MDNRYSSQHAQQPSQQTTSGAMDSYALHDKYTRQHGRVFLTGTQALVRLPLLQRQLDRDAGLNTAGFISGYRGSPLGGYDLALWHARDILAEQDIEFLPAINEDLAATAILGTQQVEGDSESQVEGVFSIWYGKGPGVDRAGDVLKHGNAYGSSPNGGVLVIAGDDHGCVSSSMSHQSDVAFMTFFMPTLNPASVAEYIEFGLYGLALSRYSGTWVGFKAISETVESAASITLHKPTLFKTPLDYHSPEDGLHYRWPDLPGAQVENRMVAKLEAVQAFARSNPIDRCLYSISDARLGIISTGKGHLDLMEALLLLGMDEPAMRKLGIDIYKIGMVWPLEIEGAQTFCRNKEEVLVVEEKRGLIESQLKECLYGHQNTMPTHILGKHDAAGKPLIPWIGELSPTLLAPILAQRISQLFPQQNFTDALARLSGNKVSIALVDDIKRQPYFCAGCPHSTSTKIPEGSKALAGIGCHFMASWMDRNTESLIQMGGEGVNWVGKSRFNGKQHIFQNLGDGTYFHSGSLAIRQAIAAQTHITYKILFNDAVAMTGGQAIDGTLTVDRIAHQVYAEGVHRIALVSNDIDKYTDKARFPPQVTFHHRDTMDSVQRELRDIPGVTVLIYDQLCAAEKRRQQKRGEKPAPSKRVFINEAVCENCGDCSTQSNCLAIYPVETSLGRKRAIDQSSCNHDIACINGFCPSFITVEGATLKKPAASGNQSNMESQLQQLPMPALPSLSTTYNMLIAGIGGTGVATLAAITAMAAHLEGKGASVLDFTGFAQKGGTVISHIRLGKTPADIYQARIADGMADLVLACDIIASSDQQALNTLSADHCQIVINDSEVPTGQFVLNRHTHNPIYSRIDAISGAVGKDNTYVISANQLMQTLLGDTVYANSFLLGYAWQQGLLPLSLDSLTRAIELNAVDIDNNKQAFQWGRLAQNNNEFVINAAKADQHTPKTKSVDDIIQHRMALLTEYQNADYADQYHALVSDIVVAESSLNKHSQALSEAVANNLFKVMAYKDEYEVARLFSSGDFMTKVNNTFAGDFRIHFYMASPLLAGGYDEQGRPKKRQLGPWILKAMTLLAKLKVLRGTPFDLFGLSAERKQEKALAVDYAALVIEITARLNSTNYDAAIQCARLPDQVRGFGPVKNKTIEVYYKERGILRDQLSRVGK